MSLDVTAENMAQYENELLNEDNAVEPVPSAADATGPVVEPTPVAPDLEVSNSNKFNTPDTSGDVVDDNIDNDADEDDDDEDGDAEMVFEKDPEAFGPFTQSQLAPVFQTDVDRHIYDAFQDNMNLLKTAIGKFNS